MSVNNFYKNPNRNEAPKLRPKYVPHYVEEGLEPENMTTMKKRISVLPSSNTEESIVNNFVDSGMGFLPKITDSHSLSSNKDESDNKNILSDDFIFDDEEGNKQLKNSDYFLIVDDVFFAQGTFDEIQKIASQLFFGIHPKFKDQSISTDQILIFKKINIKVGLFIEE